MRMGWDCLLPVGALALVLSVAGVYQAAAGAQPSEVSAGTGDSAGDCKVYGDGPCCDRQIARHLSRSAIFAACSETAKTFVGEQGSKDTCRYVFEGGGFVEVYAPVQDSVPPAPSDPFFAWSKVGKAFVTVRATTPKSAPVLAASTGIFLPGDGYIVSVNASTKVCTRGQAQQLARSVR